MGYVRMKMLKKSSRQVIEKYYSRMTLDFHTNKKLLEEVAIIPSKRLYNRIVGFSTHLMGRIQHGPVCDISFKLYEEECERRMNFVPDESVIKVDNILVDGETLEMLSSIGMDDLPDIEKQSETTTVSIFADYPGGSAALCVRWNWMCWYCQGMKHFCFDCFGFWDHYCASTFLGLAIMFQGSLL